MPTVTISSLSRCISLAFLCIVTGPVALPKVKDSGQLGKLTQWFSCFRYQLGAAGLPVPCSMLNLLPGHHVNACHMTGTCNTVPCVL